MNVAFHRLIVFGAAAFGTAAVAVAQVDCTPPI